MRFQVSRGLSQWVYACALVAAVATAAGPSLAQSCDPAPVPDISNAMGDPTYFDAEPFKMAGSKIKNGVKWIGKAAGDLGDGACKIFGKGVAVGFDVNAASDRAARQQQIPPGYDLQDGKAFLTDLINSQAKTTATLQSGQIIMTRDPLDLKGSTVQDCWAAISAGVDCGGFRAADVKAVGDWLKAHPRARLNDVPDALPFDPPGFGCDLATGELVAIGTTCEVTLSIPPPPPPSPPHFADGRLAPPNWPNCNPLTGMCGPVILYDPIPVDGGIIHMSQVPGDPAYVDPMVQEPAPQMSDTVSQDALPCEVDPTQPRCALPEATSMLGDIMGALPAVTSEGSPLQQPAALPASSDESQTSPPSKPLPSVSLMPTGQWNPAGDASSGARLNPFIPFTIVQTQSTYD